MSFSGRVKVILVTGPIGSGKSEVCRFIAEAGYPVYDCDSRTKMLYSLVPGLKCTIEDRVGLPFGRLGEVFGDPEKLSELESVVYPYVLEDVRSWIAGVEGGVAFVESAVALGKPVFDGLWDAVLLVKADGELRHSRNPKAAGRDAFQSFDESKADFIIENNSSLEKLREATDKFLQKI